MVCLRYLSELCSDLTLPQDDLKVQQSRRFINNFYLINKIRVGAFGHTIRIQVVVYHGFNECIECFGVSVVDDGDGVDFGKFSLSWHCVIVLLAVFSVTFL